MLNIVLTVFLCLLLNACSLEPQYLRPQLPVNNDWPKIDNESNSLNKEELSKQEKIANINSEISAEPSTPVNTSTVKNDLRTVLNAEPKVSTPSEEKPVKIANINWKKFFKSLKLQQIISEALNNNRDLRIAALNIEAARAAYRLQESNSMPNIKAEASSARQFTPKNASSIGRPQYVSIYNSNISSAFEIDLFGQIKNLNKSALENYLASQETRKAVQISLIAATANAYLQWVSDKEIALLAEDMLHAQQKNFELTKAGYDKGVNSKINLLQEQTVLENSKVNKSIYERIVAQDKTALLLLVGSTNENLLEGNHSLEEMTLLEQLPVNLPSEVLLNRPDIQAYEHQLKAQYANIGAARAAFFPKISLTSVLGFANTALTGLFTGGTTTGMWSFTPQAVLPIFTGEENRANLENAKVAQKIAIANYEKAIQTAFKEVADDLIARKAITEQLKLQTEIAKNTKFNNELAFARYKVGTDNYLSVVNSKIISLTSQQDLINAKQQYFSNLINLYKALGGEI